jgi:hypothetical protein
VENATPIKRLNGRAHPRPEDGYITLEQDSGPQGLIKIPDHAFDLFGMRL